MDVPKLAREVIADIGFTDAKMGFDAKTCGILNAIQTQSPDIAMGVDTGGAGDQGLMFGYACDETPELMPLPIMMAHKLVRQLSDDPPRRASSTYLRPDGKSQVSVEYVDGKPKRIDAVVISTQHDDDVTTEAAARRCEEVHHRPGRSGGNMVDSQTKYHINPTGRFVIGGPHGDTGLTGRKIIVDTYGGMGRHGGGAFSGKDPTKVDRSACYMARYVAKNIVAAGLASRCEVQLAYAIGVAEPVSVMVNTFGTGTVPEERLVELVRAELQAHAEGHDRDAEAAPSDLSQDRRVRPLRPHRRHLHLGSHRQGRSSQGRRQARRRREVAIASTGGSVFQWKHGPPNAPLSSLLNASRRLQARNRNHRPRGRDRPRDRSRCRGHPAEGQAAGLPARQGARQPDPHASSPSKCARMFWKICCRNISSRRWKKNISKWWAVRT